MTGSLFWYCWLISTKSGFIFAAICAIGSWAVAKGVSWFARYWSRQSYLSSFQFWPEDGTPLLRSMCGASTRCIIISISWNFSLFDPHYGIYQKCVRWKKKTNKWIFILLTYIAVGLVRIKLIVQPPSFFCKARHVFGILFTKFSANVGPPQRCDAIFVLPFRSRLWCFESLSS